jgi:hypothetical protein
MPSEWLTRLSSIWILVTGSKPKEIESNMRQIPMAGDEKVIVISNSELDLLCDALLVRVKTLEASLQKAKAESEDIRKYLIEEKRKHHELLLAFGQLAGIPFETIEIQLAKNPWLKGAL